METLSQGSSCKSKAHGMGERGNRRARPHPSPWHTDLKTTVTVFPDGRFTLTTTNRGEAASRWVAQIQGKKIVRAVPPPGEPEPGE